MTDKTYLARQNAPQRSDTPKAKGITSRSPVVKGQNSLPSSRTSQNREEAIAEFLQHYESFVGNTVEDPLVWQSQSFSRGKSSQPVWSSPWVKVGVLGVGGATALVAGNAVWPHREAVPTPSTLQQTLSNFQTKATPSTVSVSPPSSTASIEFSPPSPSFTQVQVPKVVSPAIRAPLPGQVIRQQGGALNSVPVSQARPLQVRPTAPPAQPQFSEPAKTPDSGSQSVATPGLSAAANGQSQVQALPEESGLSEVLDRLHPSDGKAINEVSREVIPDRASESLKPAIASAQTIHDFIELSSKIPQDKRVVLSLTPQAAIAIPRVEQFEQFQVFRVPKADYEQAWSLLSRSTNLDQSAPTYGFVDYHKRFIILVSS